MKRILPVLEELAPLRYAEGWDNVGLLVGDPRAEVKRVLVTVDYTAAVAEEAVALSAGLVVAYHPPMFASVKRVPHGALWAEAVRRGIALYSMHTALDVAASGTNDFLARACGALVAAPLRPGVDPGTGLGRIGDIPPVPLAELVRRVKSALSLDHVLVAGSLSAIASRVAVAAGAGGELLEDAMRLGADVFVTGELRHHDALSVVARGGAVIATLHSNSERAAVKDFAARLGARLAHEGVVVTASDADADPFAFA